MSVWLCLMSSHPPVPVEGSSATQNFSSLAQNLTSLYVAPASLQDYCDSSGCLPGQIPLPSAGLSSKAILNKQATARMQQVRTPYCVFHPFRLVLLYSVFHYLKPHLSFIAVLTYLRELCRCCSWQRRARAGKRQQARALEWKIMDCE
eukprot:3497192-Rhodomonas_salina.1